MMKHQRGIIVVLGAAWLVFAAGAGSAADVDYQTKDKIPTHTAESASTSTKDVREEPVAPAYIGTSLTTITYKGTRYRNEGYFGEKNSDGGN
ncbi:MAG: hypothetical protein WBP86_15125 [Thiobacillaceae bacterium]